MRLRFLAGTVAAMATVRSADNMLLGKRIKRLRSEAGRRDGRKQYTQAELAAMVHESEGTVSNWERGLHVTPEKVALVTSALGMDAGEDLGELPEDEPSLQSALAHVRAAHDMLRRLIEAQSNPST